MRRHAIEQVVLSSSNRLSKRKPLAKRFKTDLIPMFVGALIACFFLSIVWTVRIQKVEEKKHGGKDVLDGLVPNTNTKFLKSTPPEEFSAIPKDDYANDDDIDDDNEDDDNERGRDDEEQQRQEEEEEKKRRQATDEYQKNIENRAKATSRMNEHTREEVIEELFEKAQREDEKKHDAQVFESLSLDGEEKEEVKKAVLKKEEEVVQLSMKPSPVPVVKKEKKAEKRKEIEVEEIEEEITDETKASVAQKARKHKSLHATTLKHLAALARTPTVLSLERKVTAHGKITCGGTEAVVFKTWHNFFTANENITRTLPPVEPRITEVVNHAQRYCRHRGECDFTKIYANAKLKNDEKMNKKQPCRNDEVLPTCAVVGNAGSLRNAKFGEEIDAHDIVLRFNNGRAKHFEKQVGTKGHLRMYNGPYVEGKMGGEVTIAQLRDSSVNHWIRQYEKHRETFPESFIMDPEIICRAWDLVNREGEKPSSGMVGITFAMRLCSSVDIYGFSAESYFNETERPHYYDWERPKPGRENVHPFEAERKIYKALQKEGLITLHEIAVGDENSNNPSNDSSTSSSSSSNSNNHDEN